MKETFVSIPINQAMMVDSSVTSLYNLSSNYFIM